MSDTKKLFENIQNNLNGDNEKVKAYYFLVGITYDKDIRPDADELEFYEYENSKIPFKITDENLGETKTYKEALNYVVNYIMSGVDGTCGFIIEKEVDKREYDSIYNGYCDNMDLYAFSDDNSNIIYSAYKKDNKINICIDKY